MRCVIVTEDSAMTVNYSSARVCEIVLDNFDTYHQSLVLNGAKLLYLTNVTYFRCVVGTIMSALTINYCLHRRVRDDIKPPLASRRHWTLAFSCTMLEKNFLARGDSKLFIRTNARNRFSATTLNYCLNVTLQRQ